ncbi:phosphoribosyltransferase-like protein [Methylomonas sp. BW4-1]|uniref:phosphoribosyltransferase-like protein n=1 Tax=Methylomonas sp. BW4-1 TaxID=3376685 RepID=UPI0040427446
MNQIVIIIVSAGAKDGLCKKLDEYAGFNWQKSNQLALIELPRGIKKAATYDFIDTEIKRLFPLQHSKTTFDLWVPDDVFINTALLDKKGKYSISPLVSTKNLRKSDSLNKKLKASRLDWLSRATSVLKRYNYDTINEEQVEHWLDQFKILNAYQIGKNLIGLFIIPETNEIFSFFQEKLGKNNRILAFHEDKSLGKSGAFISTLLSKIDDNSLRKAHEAIDDNIASQPIFIVEDGLFSGTETCSILESLQNKKVPPKVPPLKNIENINSKQITLHFAAVCDLGLRNVMSYLSANNLTNIKIEEGYINFNVSNNTPEIDPYIFQELHNWKPEQKQKAQELCKDIGKQLWRLYISQKFGNDFDQNKWPTARIELCSLGKDGIGLAFAFTHSVPKATLPIFWARGEVFLNVNGHNKKIYWEPLFKKIS